MIARLITVARTGRSIESSLIFMALVSCLRGRAARTLGADRHDLRAREELLVPGVTGARFTLLLSPTTNTKLWLPWANTASSGTTSAPGRSEKVTDTFADM